VGLFKLIGCLLLSLILVGCEASAKSYLVRWTPFIKIQDINDADKAIDEYDDLDTIRQYGNTSNPESHRLTMVCSGSPEIKVTSGREYLNCRKKGYFAKTNWDILHEFRFLDNVVVLEKLKEAKPSKVSYLEDFSLDDNCLNKLPPTLALEVKDDTHLKEAEKKGISWQKYDPSIHIKKRKNEDEIILESPDEETSAYIAHVGWGDFNNDGIEDVLLIVHNYINNATFRDHEFVIITKTGPDKAMKRIYWDEG
jgi:hypothetical protein